MKKEIYFTSSISALADRMKTILLVPCGNRTTTLYMNQMHWNSEDSRVLMELTLDGSRQRRNGHMRDHIKLSYIFQRKLARFYVLGKMQKNISLNCPR